MSFSLSRNNKLPVKKILNPVQVPSVSSNVQALSKSDLSLDLLKINNQVVSVSGNELNYLDTDKGIGNPNKAIVVDSDRNITNINTISCDTLYVNNNKIIGISESSNIDNSNSPYIKNIKPGITSPNQLLTLDTNSNIKNINQSGIKELILNNSIINDNNLIVNNNKLYYQASKIIELLKYPQILYISPSSISNRSFLFNSNQKMLLTTNSIIIKNKYIFSNSNISSNAYSIAYSPTLKLYIAGLSVNNVSGVSSSIVLGAQYSNDGISWTTTEIPVGTNAISNNSPGGQWSIAYWCKELNLFLLGNRENTNGNARILYSSNGINWSIGYTSTSSLVLNIIWSTRDSKLYAFCNDVVLSSTNGINWTSAISVGSDRLWNAIYIDEKNLFFGNIGANIYIGKILNNSLNLINTTNLTTEITHINYFDQLNLFIAISGNKLNYSFNLYTWTTLNNLPSSVIASSAWIPELELLLFGTENTTISLISYPFNFKTKNLSYLDNNKNIKYTNDPIQNWYLQPISNNNFTSITYSGDLGLYVAVASSGVNNRVITSNNGITWINRIAPNNDWSSICWSSELNLFVTVASSGVGNRVMTSNDGINWISRSTPADNNWNSVCWSSKLNLFVAVASSGVGNRVMTSNDGINWISRSSSNNSNWSSVCYSSIGLFIAVASSGSSLIMTSPDGINWTNRVSPNSHSLTSVTCSMNGLGLIVAISNNGSVITSEDGINWISRISHNGNWKSICFSEELNLLVAISSDSTNNIMKSTDGINWSLMSSNNGAWNNICWSSDFGMFVGIGLNILQISNICSIGIHNSLIKNNVSTLLPVNSTLDYKWSINTTRTTSQLNIGSDSMNKGIRLRYNQLENDYVDFDYQNSELKITSNNNIKIINFNTPYLTINSTRLITPISTINKLNAEFGVATNNKFLNADDNRDINNLNIVSSKKILINNSLLLSSNDNNNIALQNITNGIVSPNKVIIPDSNKNISNINTIQTNKLTINNSSINSNTINNLYLDNGLSNGIIKQKFPTNISILDIAWSPTLRLFIAVGQHSDSGSSTTQNASYYHLMRSYNGIDWEGVLTPNSPAYNYGCITWSSDLNLFVAISQIGGTTNYGILSSSDGINWFNRTIPAVNTWSTVTWGGVSGSKVFVALSSNGTNRLMTSPDGITWTSRTITSQTWSSVVWSPELNIFAAISSNGATTAISTSPNGITWTLRSVPISAQWTSITWGGTTGNKRFVACAQGSQIMTSTDGITWTLQTTLSGTRTPKSIIWASNLNKFIIVCNTGINNRIITSSDGINWSTAITQNLDINYQTICYSPELNIIVAGGNASGVYKYNNISTSIDSDNWILRDTSYDGARQIIWSNILNSYIGVMGGASGQKRKDMISSLDGYNWTLYPSNLYDTIYGEPLKLLEISELSIILLSTSSNIYKSTNGTFWTLCNTPTPLVSISNFAYASSINTIVGIGNTNAVDTSRIVYSIDGGNNWSYINTILPIAATGGGIKDIVWSPILQKFAIIANNYIASPIYTSNNGIDWTPSGNISRTTRVSNNIIWDDKLSAFIGFTTTNVVYYSHNSINWGEKTLLLPNTSIGSTTNRLLYISELDIYVIIILLTNNALLCYTSNLFDTWKINPIPYFNGHYYGPLAYSPILKQLVVASYEYTGSTMFSGFPFITYNLSKPIESKSSNNLSNNIKFSKFNNNLLDNLLNSWTLLPATYGGNYSSICYSSSLKRFVACASSGTNRILSYNNNTHSIIDSGSSVIDSIVMNSICWSDYYNRFITVGLNTISYSGFESTSIWTNISLTNNWTSICWSHDLKLFVAVANSGTNNRIAYSINFGDWVYVNFNYNNNLSSICWSPDLKLFVAVANSGTNDRVITSSNGINWSIQSSASDNNWTSVCWASKIKLFVAVASSGIGNRIMTSSDGINWIGRTSPADNNWTSVCWSDKLEIFVAVASSGIGDRIMTSSDGINWIGRTSPADNNWTSVTWAEEYGSFIAVSNDGTNKIMFTMTNYPTLFSTVNTLNSVLTINQSNHFVGINKSNPNYLLDVNSSTAMKPTTSTWTITSDERLKENIEPANTEECYNNIKNIPLKYYKWKDSIYSKTDVPDRHKVGWIAQDVEKYIPSSISTINQYDIKDCKTLNSDQIIANMHGCILELLKIYDNQKNKLKEVNNDIDIINKFIQNLKE